MQQAWDYDQWLRRQEGPAEALAFTQSFMPGGAQQQWQRKPSKFGQIFGGLLGAAGAASGFVKPFIKPIGPPD
jgi:hypothetical protein